MNQSSPRHSAVLAIAALLAALLTACGGTGGGESSASGAMLAPSVPPGSSGATLTKLSASPNPSGLRVGFWEVYNKQAHTLSAMGKRPSSRVGFDNWATLEKAPGVYSFPEFTGYGAVHNYGQSILAAVNLSFTGKTVRGPQPVGCSQSAQQTIPCFYNDDITDAQTRAAAKRFLYAYVQQLLAKVGSLVLTIDYEVVSNYRLSAPGSEARAAQWGAWYVEAAAVARQAAHDAGKADQLKLQPIVNGNPFAAGNPIGLGAAHNPWLTRVVAASDFLALDTYHSDPAQPVTDPHYTMRIIQFWIDNYAGDKDVVVTENGFTTITEQDQTITRTERDMKLTGTNAEQAAYYQALFPLLLAANRPEGAFHNKLRGFHIWSIIDNKLAADVDDRYFGLMDLAGAPKPAAAIVKSALDALEADSFHQPYRINAAASQDVTQALSGEGPAVPLRYTEGDAFEFLRYQDSGSGSAAASRLQVSFTTPGNLIASVNGIWFYVENQVHFDVDVSSAYRAQGTNTIDIYATGATFPVTQQLKSVKLAHP